MQENHTINFILTDERAGTQSDLSPDIKKANKKESRKEKSVLPDCQVRLRVSQPSNTIPPIAVFNRKITALYQYRHCKNGYWTSTYAVTQTCSKSTQTQQTGAATDYLF